MAVLAALHTLYDGRAGVRATELETTTTLSRSTVRSHLSALEKAGDVAHDGDGKCRSYRPTVRPSEHETSDERNGATRQ